MDEDYNIIHKIIRKTRNGKLKWNLDYKTSSYEKFVSIIQISNDKKIEISFIYHNKIDFYVIYVYILKKNVDHIKRISVYNTNSGDKNLKDDIILIHDSINFQLKSVDF